jgi:hypothetical protein
MSSSNVVPIGDNKVPDFITRVDINQMNDEQLEALLSGIRERRMVAFIVYEQTLADKEQAATEKALVAIDKEITQILKCLDTLDKAFEKLETRINKLRGLRIQAGLNVI